MRKDSLEKEFLYGIRRVLSFEIARSESSSSNSTVPPCPGANIVIGESRTNGLKRDLTVKDSEFATTQCLPIKVEVSVKPESRVPTENILTKGVPIGDSIVRPHKRKLLGLKTAMSDNRGTKKPKPEGNPIGTLSATEVAQTMTY